MDFIDVRGASGAAYRFRVWPEGQNQMPMAGNYVVARGAVGATQILLIGVTHDLSRARDQAKAVGAEGQVFTRLNVARTVRAAEHADLAASHPDAQVQNNDP